MRTRNMRTEHDSKLKDNEFKLDEFELRRLRYAPKRKRERRSGVIKEKEKETTTRDRHSETRESRDSKISETKNSQVISPEKPNTTKHNDSTSKLVIDEPKRSNKQQTRQAEMMPPRQFNILIGATGSVATIKLVELIETLKTTFPMTVSTLNGCLIPVSINVKVILTENAKQFTAPSRIKETFQDNVKVHDDKEEWDTWSKMGDAILHIELRKWADVFLIAPLDANTMGKLASGICDNLLTCTARAWAASKPLIFCPAMNVHMYDHPITKEQMTKLQTFGYIKIDSIAKKLACGDIGMGAMASVDTIVNKLVEVVANVCNQQDKPSIIISLNNSVNLIPASLASRTEVLNGNISSNKFKSNQITIQPVRQQTSQLQVQNLDMNPARKRRRKSNPDGSDELQDELDSRSKNTIHNSNFSSQFSSNRSLSVTIPSLRNNRISLGLNHSISIKPKTLNVNGSTPTQPRILSQTGSSMARALNSLTHDKLRISDGVTSSIINCRGAINLCKSDKSIIKLGADQVLINNDQGKDGMTGGNGDCNDATNEECNIKDRNCPEELNNADLTDFDPSNLLEQTMITDDAIIVDNDPKNAATVAADDDSMNSGTSLQQRQDLTGSPLIDTQRFLTMCYHQETNVFKCTICKNEYKTRKSMSRHLKEQHVQGPIFSCQACNVSYKRREKLIKHAREKHLHDNMFPQYME